MGTQVMISLIVARSDNFAIGCDNRLPWNVPSDLRRFKKITTGHPIVMGRNTYDSIGQPLPNRTNIVVSRDADIQTMPRYRDQDICVFDNLDEALAFAEKVALSSGKDELMIIGGAEIFDAIVNRANRVYLTEIHTNVADGDTFFRHAFGEEKWNLNERVRVREPDDEFESTFSIWDRDVQSKTQRSRRAA